ncbi:MAG: MBL fold metallo-hydrolase [Deltaproteobacteria bacterium]|nr:MBL fold metallo-hydrolase [Deltaproteobacteria bacterium]
MNIKVLGAHNCERQNQKPVSLLIDDVLAIDAGSLTSSLSLEEQRKIKALLLTHQHYDHVRDVPALGMSLFLGGAATRIYSIPAVLDVLARHLLNDEIYPDFRQKPENKPTLNFTVLEPNKAETIEGYTVLAVPVNHSVPTVGYQVTSADGKSVFYTGDTGPGLADCWQQVSPQLLIIEVTASDKYAGWVAGAGHLAPSLLKQELESFQKVNGYLPRVVAVHMNPDLEGEIAAEIAAVAQALGCSITLACEGMEISL